MKKTVKLLFIIAFFALCIIPIACIGFDNTIISENRTLSGFPSLTTENGQLNTGYFDELQTYVSEHFAFRSKLIETDSIVKYNLFNSSSDSQVILGKDDWMFFDETMNDYAGVTLSDSEIDSIAAKLSSVCEYITAQKKQPLIMIVPNKNSIYPEYMPSRFGDKATTTNLILLQNAMSEKGVPYLDVYSILMENKEVDELYLHYDTHWNNTGARIVLNELYESLGISYRYSIGDYTIEASHQPDLYNILFPTEEFYEDQHIYSAVNDYDYVGRFRTIDDLNISTTCDNGNGLSILLYRDSFGRAMIPYMAEVFDSCSFNRSTPYNLSLVAETECDYVVIEIVERNLADLGDIEIP